MEREAELAAIARRLASARDGAGGVVFLDGAPGLGKTRLLETAAGIARDRRMRVLWARGGELEREFPFGLAIQLFEPPWRAADVAGRAVLAGGPARRAAEFIDGSLDDAHALLGEMGYTLIHALFWLACNLVVPRSAQIEGGPVAILVDDVQWADAASLRFLAYLSGRLRTLPIALIVAARDGDPAHDQRALRALRAAAGDDVLRLRPLTEPGVAELVRATLPGADAAVSQACVQITSGNPFLVAALLDELRTTRTPAEWAAAPQLAELSPPIVLDRVSSALGGVSAEARALASAVALFGEGVSLQRAAAVANLDIDTALAAAESLAAAHLLHGGTPLAFAHPLTQSAVTAGMSPLRKAQLHRRAALVLARERAGYEQIALHLIAAVPEADPSAIETLREAARIAASAETPDAAAAALERSLAETPTASSALRARAEPGAAEPGAAHRDGPHGSTGQRRLAAAQLGIQSSVRGDHRAAVTHFGELAWADGALLEDAAPGPPAWCLVAAALLFVDELERSLKICDAAVLAGKDRSGPSAYAAAGYCRAWSLYHQGRTTEALEVARALLEGAPDGWRAHALSAYGPIAAAELQRGRLGEADEALSLLSEPEAVADIDLPVLLEVRAQLRLAQLRPRDAVADAREAGRLAGFATKAPGLITWRSTAALGHLALGERGPALELASEELELAQRADTTRVIIRALRVLGLAERGTRSLDLLEEATAIGNSHPPRLEHVHALLDFGAALRRANKRSAAREPLRSALELGTRGGSLALAEQARHELAATGARPRRVMLSGLDALTPSERRVADLAARGLTTRQIAESLFVTTKTVEFHLRHVYRKLDIPSSRSELAKALGPAGEESQTSLS